MCISALRFTVRRLGIIYENMEMYVYRPYQDRDMRSVRGGNDGLSTVDYLQ